MSHSNLVRFGIAAVLLAVIGLRSPSVLSDTAYTHGVVTNIFGTVLSRPAVVAQDPLYMREAVPPLNMLVMGKDHKIYYEAYNDASDLNGDGILDVGYKPALTYYGYFNSNVCYTWNSGDPGDGGGGRFVPATATTNKQCTGQWSGDFLNYLTTSRMDALRRVLYGGWRKHDAANATVLQGAFFPQDGHSWGKEYRSVDRDGYDISRYSPLPLPSAGRYHLFAITTTRGNANTFPGYQAPLFRVMQNSPFRIWNWLSIEGPVAGNGCFTASNSRVNCLGGGHPGHPNNRIEFDNIETAYAVPANYLYGPGRLDSIDCGVNCNPQGQQDNFLSIIEGEIEVEGTRFVQFRVDGDDAIDFQLRRRNGTVVAEAGCYGGRGFGACGGGELTVPFDPTREVYSFKFRQEEAGGGEGFRLQYRRCTVAATCPLVAWTTVTRSGDVHFNSAALTTYTLDRNGASRTDYLVRVETCPASNAALRDASCKGYPSGSFKPTGILHDYGEGQRMYFGLITGSQRNNLEGGMLRRNVSNFADEIDASNGTFRTDVEGIARSIDRLRMIGGNYNNGVTDNTGDDQNWNWANGTGNCPSIGGRPINNGECRMWGNPIAEMMYESMRYFAGANVATPRFATGGSSEGQSEERTLGLVAADWRNPYGSGETGLNYPSCAKPYQTVLSDINPSYDGDLPGSAFTGANTSVGVTPAGIASFNAANEGGAIWAAEPNLGSARNVFIGEAGSVSDGNPTPKASSSLGNIRGLAPEEPAKLGTYYAASVAKFARENDVNDAPGAQNLATYSIALGSPLPRIQFPLGDQTVTLLPFAKTVSGTFGGDARKPTNTIVDFYVEDYVNFPGMPRTGDNEGRPRAVFRINYEDVEQGNDHDMDAIARYEVVANADNTVTVTVISEYQAGSANQVMGYVMSGTTRDGVYLEVRDIDGGVADTDYRYELNTPPSVWAGGCVGRTATAPCVDGLPRRAVRTFSPSSSAPAIQLRDPLWYAAKYGSPNPGSWDTRVRGEPDNYFLVTNPLFLKTQLEAAFEDIATREIDVGNRSVSGARVSTGSFTLQPSFARRRNSKDWTGNVTAVGVYENGTNGPTVWNAATVLNATAPADRNIFAMIDPTAATAAARAVPFRADTTFGANETQRLDRIGISIAGNIARDYGASYTSTDLINYLRGARVNEVGDLTDTTVTNKTLRQRGGVLGDIVNSEPVIFSPTSDFGYGQYPDPEGMFDGYEDTGSSGYLRTKRTRKPVVYVGANDGMLHAFDASSVDCPRDSLGRVVPCPTATSGRELFGFVPNGVLRNLSQLPLPDTGFRHRYYVDGQIGFGDARRSDGVWRSIVIGSTGAGGAGYTSSGGTSGRSIFALDVTNVQTRSESGTSFTANNVLWERTAAMDRDIGNIMGKPMLLPLENGQWGVLFGNGYGGSRSDPSLYILNAFDGSLIRKITANDGNIARTGLIEAILGGACELIGTVLNIDVACTGAAAHPYNGLGQITAIDRDGNGRADTVYGGDLQGNLWKFDLRGSTTANWNVYNYPTVGRVPMFTAATGSERQPITGGIRVSAGPAGGVMVFFGTGRYVFQGDNEVLTNPQVQSLYGLYDNGPQVGNTGAVPASDRSRLVAQSIGSQTNASGFRIRNVSQNTARYFGGSAVRGWYLDLKLTTEAAGDGERFISTPQIQSGRVFFTTYTPSQNATGCSPGGLNWQYGLSLLSGGGALSNVENLAGNTICTGPECGGVTLADETGNFIRAPITSNSILAFDQKKYIPGGGCDVATGVGCATAVECKVVVHPAGTVLNRPCGRQSWRQLQ